MKQEKKIKLTVMITKKQKSRIEKLAKKTTSSEAEIIRDVLNKHTNIIHGNKFYSLQRKMDKLRKLNKIKGQDIKIWVEKIIKK